MYVEQMGTSMSKAVFTEVVVEGLKRWRAKARKNVAIRSPNRPARPSLDTSLETSVDTSPSFNTLDASFSAEHYAAVDVRDDDIEDEEAHIVVGRQKVGSFHGFDLTNKY